MNHPNPDSLRRWLAAVSLFGMLLMAEAGWSQPIVHAGRAERDSSRTPQLLPDEIPAIRVEGILPVQGKYLSVYYSTGTRIAPGASAWSVPELQDVRKTLLDYRVAQDGSSRFEAQVFERSSRFRVNYVILLSSDQPLNRSGWKNADGSCASGVDVCANLPGIKALAIIPISALIREAGEDAVKLNARDWFKVIRSGTSRPR